MSGLGRPQPFAPPPVRVTVLPVQHPDRTLVLTSARALSLLLGAAPLWAHAAPASKGFSATSILALPFLLALAVGLHVVAGRGLKALVASMMPLASGQPESGGYSRSVYGTPDRAMLEVVGLVLASGLVMWIGSTWSWGWIIFLGVLMLVGALALDLHRWERVTVSANYVWFQRGLGSTVHQVAIENIHDVNVTEEDAEGFSPRHLTANRVCRLTMRMSDKRVVALPKTDAYTDLEAVETLANLIRTRQQLADARQAVKRSGDRGSEAAAAAAAEPPTKDKEMMRELRRLRQRAQAPDGVPAAVRREPLKRESAPREPKAGAGRS